MRKGFWTKKDSVVTGLSRICAGPRGYTVYYKGTNEDDATYVGSIRHVISNAFGTYPADTVNKTIFTMRYIDNNGHEHNDRHLKRWSHPDEARDEVLKWCREHEDFFKPKEQREEETI